MADKKPCRCNCGYRCGGPGRCKDPQCLSKNDGKHYVVDCEHKWNGEWVEVGMGAESITCSTCGIACINHDVMLGP